MALFANLNKNAGMMGYLEVDKVIKTNLNVKQNEKDQENYMTDYFEEGKYENLTTVGIDELDYEDHKKFWMNVMKPSKFEREIIDKIKFKIKLFEFIIAFLAISSILLSQIEYEVEYYPKMYLPTCMNPTNVNSYKGQPARIVLLILCLIMAALTIYNSILFHEQEREEKKVVAVKYYGSFYFKRMVLEVLVILVHPIPYVDFCFQSIILNESINYRLCTFLYALMFLKLFTFLRIIATYTKYSNNLSKRYCKQYGSEASSTFAIKALQKEHPFVILIFNFCSTSVVLGILLRMFEILDTNNANQMNYAFYSNGIWNIFVTMTTVGYGDFYPATNIGRFIIVVAIAIGLFLISLTIVALNRLTSLEANELQAYVILNRLRLRKKLNEVFIENLKTRLQIYLLRKRRRVKALTKDMQYMKYVRDLREITENKRELKRQLNKESFGNEQHKFLGLSDSVEEKINFVNENLKLMQSYKSKIKGQLNSQKKLMTNMDASLKLFRTCIKPGYFQLFGKNPSFVLAENYEDQTEFLASINTMNTDDIKQLSLRQLEGLVFNESNSGKNDGDEDRNRGGEENLMFNNLLMKEVNENFKKYREKYSADNCNALNDSIDSVEGHDKDIVLAEYRKINELDKKTKQIYSKTSKKTIDLLDSLRSIKFKNIEVSSQNPDLAKLTMNLPQKVNIFKNLINDEGKQLEKEILEKENIENEKINMSPGGNAKRLRAILPKSTMKPLDIDLEKLKSLSPSSSNTKLINRESARNMGESFKIKLVDISEDNTGNDNSVEIINSNSYQEKASPKRSYKNVKKNAPTREEKYISQDPDTDNSLFEGKDEALLRKEQAEQEPKPNMKVKSSLMGRLHISRDIMKK